MKLDSETREGTVMLIKAIIGAAALVFPRCYQRAGIIPATIALLIAGWAGVFIGDILMDTRKTLGPKVSSFRDMGIAATGSRWGGLILDMTVTLQSFGTLCGYVVAVGDLVSSSLHKGWNVPDLIQVPKGLTDFFLLSSSTNPEQHLVISVRSFSVLVLSLFVFFPLCLLKRLESLRALAASTMVIYFIFLLVLLKECATRVVLGDFHLGTEELQVMPAAPLNWANGGFGNLLRVLPIIALSYSCVPLMIEVRRNLERRLASRQQLEATWRVVSILSFSASGFFYIATGLLGYVAFRGSTSANVLTNLEDLGWIATFVNALFAASLIVSYPLICFVVREPVRRVLFYFASFLVQKDGDYDDSNLSVTNNSNNNNNNNNNDPERGGPTAIGGSGGEEESELKETSLRTKNESPPLLIFVLEAAVVTSATLAAAIAFPGIDVVLELIGGTAAVFVSYIAPVGLFFIVKPENYQKDKIKALLIGVCGTLIGIITCYNLWASIRGSTAHTVPTQSSPKVQT